MNKNELGRLVADYASGDISLDDHAILEAELIRHPESRRLFFELVDLEVGLAFVTNETAETQPLPTSSEPSTSKQSLHRLAVGVLAIAASLMAISGLVWVKYYRSNVNKIATGDTDSAIRYDWNGLGSIRQTNCSWDQIPESPLNGHFSDGWYKLTSGVAELRFNSGSRLTIEGPCELLVDSNSSARLTAGSIVVNVSDISDGFLLKTEMANLVDDGTEYAVCADGDSTEVHVFEGNVVWQPKGSSESEFQKIKAGEATRFSKLNAAIGKRIPFGQRQFVRRLEAAKQTDAQGELIAYDGFENLAGRIRSGRSGFGWNGGWHPPGRRRANARVVDSPPVEIFGYDPTGRRMLEVANGISVQRDLMEPLPLTKAPVYLSFFLYRDSSLGRQSSFQLFVGNSAMGRAARRKAIGVAIGISSEGFPFTKNEGVIREIASHIPNDKMFCVAKLVSIEESKYAIQFRVFLEGEDIASEPTSWTVTSTANQINLEMNRIQLSCGDESNWKVDELRIGKSWNSILND